MSYIHDALKASAEQRKSTQDRPSPLVGGARARAGTVGWVGWIGRIFLMLLLALLLFWGWNMYDRRPPIAVEPPLVVEPVPKAATSSPATNAPDLSGVKISIRDTPDAAPVIPPPVSVTATRGEQAAMVGEEEVPVEAATQDPYASIPYLRQLPVELQRELQGIRFSVHIYAAKPGSRRVKYEGKMLREGDFVRPGLRVEAIIPRAVVLQYRETRFKVPAL